MSYTVNNFAFAFSAVNGSTRKLPYLLKLQLFEQNDVLLHPYFRNALHSIDIEGNKVYRGSNRSPTRFHSNKAFCVGSNLENYILETLLLPFHSLKSYWWCCRIRCKQTSQLFETSPIQWLHSRRDESGIHLLPGDMITRFPT